jgi:IPT/TIG domain-containing protein
MADSDLIHSEGPGGKRVQTGYIILFGFLLLAATGALLYGIYAACPVCEPPESVTGAAPRAAAEPLQPATSQSPGVTASPTPAAELRLIAVSPDSGPVTGGNLVRLDGIGLNNVKEVRFGGQTATPVGSPNPTSLTVKLPAHVEGRVDVVVIDGQGRDTGANPAFYTYACPPLTGKNVIWLMILAGALGAMLHGLRSFYWYVGNRQLVWSWIPMYFVLPFTGAATSTVFYLIIRGGLMSGAAESDNVFGLMAVGTLVGLFSQQALEKLKSLSEVIFTVTPTGKDARPEKPPLRVEKVEPAEGQENQPVIILGGGFAREVRVTFDDLPAKVAKVEDNAIAVTTPLHAPGKVKVVVIQGGESVEAPGGFTYKRAEPEPGSANAALP